MVMFIAGPGSPFPTGDQPVSNATADLNGDGHLDLLFANYASDNISVLLGDGNGGFTAAAPVVAGNGPREVEVGDLDGDGDIDFLSTNLSGYSITVGLNNGSGAFVTSSVAVGTRPRGLAVADLDGDGDLDFVSDNYFDNTVSVMLNNGSAGFSGSPVATGSRPVASVLADFDGDGDIDIAATNNANNNVSILFNNGSGVFTAGASAATGVGPRGITAGDLDGDGDADLVVVNFSVSSVSILINNGSGVFTASTPLATGNNPYAVVVGDLDGDGDLDIAVSNSGGSSISVFLNNGSAAFTAAPGSPFGVGVSPGGIAIGDFDEDGLLDLASSNFGTDSTTILLNQSVHAPSGTSSAIIATEDTARVLTAADFGFSDTADGNTFTGVKVTTLPGAGNLTLDGAAVTAGQLISIADINAGKLAFTGALNGNGTAYAAFTFQVQDNGDTSNGGTNLDPTPNTITIDVTPVSDEPTLIATPVDPTFTEGDSPKDLFSAVAASTIEAGQTFTSMTLTVSGAVDGASEILSFDGSQVALTNGNVVLTSGNGLTVTVTVAAGVATLTFSGASLDATHLQTLVDGLSYSNTSQDPTGGDRVVTVTELVDSGSNVGPDDNTAAPGIVSTVHVEAVNDEPTLTATAVNPTFTEGGPQVDLFDSVTVSAIEAGQRMTAMTWTVTNVASGANEFIIFDNFEIALTDGNSVVTDIDNMTIQVSLVGTTATLSFSDVSVSAGALRNLINDMSYKNTSDDPGTADRVITITELVDSGSSDGQNDNTAVLSVASTVHITAIDDEPTLAATALDPTFTEGGAAADIFSGVTASTIEAGQTFTSMTLTVEGVVDGASEILNLDGSQVALTNGNSIVTATNGLTVTVTVAAGVATLTFSGASLDAAHLQALIDALSYANTSQDPTGGDRVITVTELVDSGANGGADDNTAAPGIASTVHVTPVNDQPTLSAIAVDPTFTEGGAAVDVFTTPVVASTVEAGQTFTSMTLTVTNVSAGASEFLNLDGSDVALTNGNSVVTATNGLTVNVSLTGTTASLTFNGATLDAAHLQSLVDGIAYSNTSQDPGTADRVVTITQLVDSGSNAAPNDSTAAPGVASTVHMVPINDEPAGADKTITALEDTARLLTAADFGFSDVTDGDTLLAVKITTLPGAGTLRNNGVAVTAGQTISKADIDAGHLTFQAALNANGAAYAAFKFQVQDNGGTTGGGVDLDQTPNTLTVNVTPVNDKPSAVVLSNVHGPFPENTSTAVHIKVADIAVTDIDGGTNNLSLSGTDANLFELIGNTLWLKAGAKLDFETNPFLNVNVNANDPTVAGPIDATKALAIAVTDIAENITGTARGDRLIGTNNGETIIGLAGNDGIYGNAGNDRIVGGLGADYMTGGPGNDVFVFNSISDSAPGQSGMVNNGTFSPAAGSGLRDIITDFTLGPDKLDLSAIDANNQVGANQAFTFLGRANFHNHHPGELIYRLYDYTGTANDKTIVYGDVNGDARADFQIELTGLKLLAASDFVL